MPELGVGQIVSWLATTGVMIGIPVAVLVVVYRLGRRSTANWHGGRQPER